MDGRKVFLSACSLAMIGAIGAWMSSADDPSPVQRLHENRVLMRAKLASSQKVLEGVLSEDFSLIAAGAHEMKRISEAAEWPRSRDQIYEHYSAEFRRQCNKLESLAEKRNHEGTTFTYLHMTTMCIRCHDYVRDSLRIAEHPVDAGGGIQLIPSHWPPDQVAPPN